MVIFILTGWVYGLGTGWVFVLVRANKRLQGFPLPALRLRVFGLQDFQYLPDALGFVLGCGKRFLVYLNHRLRVF